MRPIRTVEQDFAILLAGAMTAAYLCGDEYPCNEGVACICECYEKCPVKGMTPAEKLEWAKEITASIYGEEGAKEIYASRSGGKVRQGV